jgi:hypothetical protein
LADSDDGHIEPDEHDVLDVIAGGGLGHRARQHLPGELGDGVTTDQSPAAAGDPHGVGVEERDELLDQLVLLGVLEDGDDRLDRVPIRAEGADINDRLRLGTRAHCTTVRP